MDKMPRNRTKALARKAKGGREPEPAYDFNAVVGFYPGRDNGQSPKHSQETTDSWSYVCSHKGEICEPISVIWFMGKSSNTSVVHCTIRVNPPRGSRLSDLCREGNHYHPSGHGTAGGCGYHKMSAALNTAIESAGFKLAHHFHGYGDLASEHAIMAIADFMGLPLNGKILKR